MPTLRVACLAELVQDALLALGGAFGGCVAGLSTRKDHTVEMRFGLMASPSDAGHRERKGGRALRDACIVRLVHQSRRNEVGEKSARAGHGVACDVALSGEKRGVEPSPTRSDQDCCGIAMQHRRRGSAASRWRNPILPPGTSGGAAKPGDWYNAIHLQAARLKCHAIACVCARLFALELISNSVTRQFDSAVPCRHPSSDDHAGSSPVTPSVNIAGSNTEGAPLVTRKLR